MDSSHPVFGPVFNASRPGRAEASGRESRERVLPSPQPARPNWSGQSRRKPGLEEIWHGSRLRTHWGSVLALPEGADLPLVGLPQPAAEQQLLLFRSVLKPHVGLLVSASGQNLDLYDHRLEGPIAPVLVLGGAPAGNGPVSFRSPVEEAYLAAEPPDAGTGSGPAGFNRPTIGAWEIFRPEPWDPMPLADAIEAALRDIAELLACDLAAESMSRWIRSAPDSSIGLALPSLIYLATRDALADFAAGLVRDRDLTQRVCALLPQDCWTRDSLPGLASWLGNRRTPPPETTDESHDALDALFWSNVRARGASHATALLAMSARSKVTPRRQACILATLRNEGIYLLEWIAHHRALGFEHFFLYSNNNTDDSDALLETLARHGVITWTRNPVREGQSPQLRAYCHALSCAAPILDYRWTMVMDPDEFLCLDPRRFASIQDFLALSDARQADAVAISWLVYTPSGQNSWSEGGLRQACQYRLPTYVAEIKTMIRTRKFGLSGPHDPISCVRSNFSYLDSRGGFHYHPGRDERSVTARNPTDENIWIAHYHLKSTDEYLWKAGRTGGFGAFREATGDPHNLRWLEAFLSQYDPADKQFDSRVLACAPGYGEEYRRLMALDGVASAFDAVKASYLRQVEAIRDRLLAQAAPTPDHQRLLELVRSYAGKPPGR